MALIDYMGDAPGFMSYSRQPSQGFSHLPTFKALAKAPAIPAKDKPEDDKGLSGDSQFYRNNQNAFDEGLKTLASKYGGELSSFAMNDPEYKNILNTQKYHAYNKRSLENNEVEVEKYEQDLQAGANGQQANDFALEKDPATDLYVLKTNRTPDGKGGYQEVRGFTKKQDVEFKKNNPNLKYMDSQGTLALAPVDLDRGKGDAASTSEEWNKLLAELGSFRTGGGSDNTTRVTINGVTDQQFRNWSDGHTELNFDQVNAIGDYINKNGGLSESVKYDLSQRFYKQANKEGIDFYEFDESGKPIEQKDKKGNTSYKMKTYTLDEIIANPEMQSMMQNKFQADVVKGYLNPKYAKDTYGKSGSVFENIDRRTGERTGGVDKPDDKYYFTNWLQNGASPDAEEKEVTVPVIDKNGKTTINRAVFTAISGANNFNQIAKSKASMVGKSLMEISGGSAGYDGIFSKVGGHLTGGVIGDVLEVGQMNGIPLKYNKNNGAYESILNNQELENYKKVDAQAKALEGKVSQFEISKIYTDNGFADPTLPMAKVVVFNDGTSYDFGQGELTLDEDNVLKPTHTVGMFGVTTTDEGKKYEVDATKYNSFKDQKEKHPNLSGKGTVLMVPLNPIFFKEQDAKDITKSKNTERVSEGIGRGNQVMQSGRNATGTKVSKIK